MPVLPRLIDIKLGNRWYSIMTTLDDGQVKDLRAFCERSFGFTDPKVTSEQRLLQAFLTTSWQLLSMEEKIGQLVCKEDFGKGCDREVDSEFIGENEDEI